ncbi:MAG: hypothetical protein CMB37_01280 [Euryarchaeota archaeon]|nr:hypothetical protein [Euryarchaeota archaeon]
MGIFDVRGRVEVNMRGTILVLSILSVAPMVGALQFPEPPSLDSEWIVVEDDGWTYSEWSALRETGLEPLRQISENELLVWGNHGTYQLEAGSVLRGENAEGYLVVLEPRLPSEVQLDIISMFDIESLKLAGVGSALPTSFEVHGVNPTLFDSIPGVWWVEPLLETKARNALASSIMENDSMDSHPAWELGLNGSGVIVGVADSGIELDHGCFRENETSIGEIGLNHRKIILVNTTIDDGDKVGQSDYRHGTHIAGSLGCNLWHGNVTEGTSPSHGARILFQDVVNESGWSEPSVDWLLAEALVNGAVIHSDSWGDDTESYTLRSSEFDLWHRDVPWSLAFIAPGNNPSKFYEPANARNVVSVGGSMTENTSTLYSASSHGPTEEGLRGNFIVAPATGIISATADGNVTSFNDDMRASTGTSMSTPLGASITAVIQQMVQDGWFSEDGFVPSGAMLRALLAMSAESMEGGQQGSESVGPAPDALQGWGRPNLANLIDFDSNTTKGIAIIDSFMMDEQERMELVNSWLSSNGNRPLEQVVNSHWNGTNASGPFLKNGEHVGFEFERVVGEDLEVFLSFNQRPFGTVSDNLDIVITLPNGATFRSNEPLEGTERLKISSDVLGSIESVWVEVRAIHVGVGNHTDSLGSDGDMVGFGLAVKGVVSEVIEPELFTCPDWTLVEDSQECDWDEDGIIDVNDPLIGAYILDSYESTGYGEVPWVKFNDDGSQYVVINSWHCNGSGCMNNPSDSWLHIHNTSTREVVKSTWFEDHVVDADWSPDGEYLALLTSSNLINIYQPSNWVGDDWEGEGAVSTFQASSAFPGGIKYSPDGSMIAVVSYYNRWTEINGNIEIYAPLSGELLMQGTPDQEYGKWHENDYYYSVGWNLDGSKLAVSGYEVMYIYDVESWTMELAIPEDYMVLQSIDYSPDGTMVAACSGWGDDNNHENFVAVYNATSGSKMWSYASTTPCLDVAWSPDSVLVASSHSWWRDDGANVNIFTGIDGVRVDVLSVKPNGGCNFENHNCGKVTSVDWHPNGSYIISGVSRHDVGVYHWLLDEAGRPDMWSGLAGSVEIGCYNTQTQNWTNETRDECEGWAWTEQTPLSWQYDNETGDYGYQEYTGCVNWMIIEVEEDYGFWTVMMTEDTRDVCESYVWAITDGVVLEPLVEGCTDPAYIQYNPNANLDDGSCGCDGIYSDGVCSPHYYGGGGIGDGLSYGSPPALLPPLDFSGMDLGPSDEEIFFFCCLPCVGFFLLLSFLYTRRLSHVEEGLRKKEGVLDKAKIPELVLVEESVEEEVKESVYKPAIIIIGDMKKE